MRPLRTRTLVITVALAAALSGGALSTLYSVTRVDREETAAVVNYRKAQKQYEETVGALERSVSAANSIEEWKDVLARADALPGDAKEHFTAVATIGMLEELARERDRLFLNAGELFAANEKDPEIPKVLEKAHELHKLADAAVKKLSAHPEDPDWQRALLYRKAYEQYRSLAFLNEKEHNEALDILAGALGDLRGANTVSPKNNRVELAIEFLYKRVKEEESKRGNRQSAGGRPRALPPHMGRDPGPGVGPNREQRY